jgi:hypothetical protein
MMVGRFGGIGHPVDELHRPLEVVVDKGLEDGVAAAVPAWQLVQGLGHGGVVENAVAPLVSASSLTVRPAASSWGTTNLATGRSAAEVVGGGIQTSPAAMGYEQRVAQRVAAEQPCWFRSTIATGAIPFRTCRGACPTPGCDRPRTC